MIEDSARDEAHAKLTSIVGRLMAETGKMKTYSDAIEAMLNKSVVLSQNLLDDVESLVKKSPELGYAIKEEFIQDAIRGKLEVFTRNEKGHTRLKKQADARSGQT